MEEQEKKPKNELKDMPPLEDIMEGKNFIEIEQLPISSQSIEKHIILNEKILKNELNIYNILNEKERIVENEKSNALIKYQCNKFNCSKTT